MPTNTQTMDQIQVRIDPKLKKQARKVLEDIGLDISSAIKLYFKQIVNIGNLPYEIRDINGFTPKKALEMKEAIKESRNSKKTYSSAKELMTDLMS